MDKYINTIIEINIEINIEHNYSKYHIKNSPKIARLSQDFNKILTRLSQQKRAKIGINNIVQL